MPFTCGKCMLKCCLIIYRECINTIIVFGLLLMLLLVLLLALFLRFSFFRKYIDMSSLLLYEDTSCRSDSSSTISDFTSITSKISDSTSLQVEAFISLRYSIGCSLFIIFSFRCCAYLHTNAI